MGARGTVHAIDASTGHTRWRYELWRPSIGKLGYTEVRHVGDRVVAFGGASIAVLEAATGRVLHQTKLGDHEHLSGQLLVGPQGEIFVVHAGNLYAFTPDGASRWSVQLTPRHAELTTMALGWASRF